MNNMEDFGFEDFESALFDEGYQTDDDGMEESGTDEPGTDETDDDPQDTGSEGEEDAEDGEDDEDEHTSDSEDEDAEDGEEDDSGDDDAPQTFTLKVNKEERQVSLEEMTALAQKGADYDRIKDQAAQLRQSNTDLQAKLDDLSKHQASLDILAIIAENRGGSLEQLAEDLYVNFRKSAGASEDAAREELKSARLERELNGFKAKQTQQQEQDNDSEARAKRDLEQFAKDYPDVTLDKELLDKLMPEIKNGASLSAAYRKHEKAQDAQRIAELERKLAAKKQNDKNKRRSPGSQQDSGGRRTKSDYEEFEKALFG